MEEGVEERRSGVGWRREDRGDESVARPVAQREDGVAPRASISH